MKNKLIWLRERMIAPPPAAAGRVGGRFRHFRRPGRGVAARPGHDPLHPGLAAGRHWGRFRAIRGSPPVALGGFRRDRLCLHDRWLHCRVEVIENVASCQEKFAIIFRRAGLADGGAPQAWAGRRRGGAAWPYSSLLSPLCWPRPHKDEMERASNRPMRAAGFSVIS